MVNLYKNIRSNLQFKQFEIGDLLFTEYTCPIEDETAGFWAHMDYLVHVLSGKKTWHTTSNIWVAEAGQTLFFKKGAAFVEQVFDEDFCLLLFFIPDDFVREIVKELAGDIETHPVPDKEEAIRVHDDVALSAFFQSMMAYFSGDEKPSEHLLRLKLKELIVSILLGQKNPALSSYFQSLVNSDAPSVAAIMETNYRYNLSMEEFAEMCHRSLSSFKRDFRKTFHEPPGKWLLRKRLEYSAVLLRNSDSPISQISLECGFEDISHFSRTFRAKFGVPPTAYRKQTPSR
jgi:AraC-like DNA-binding protein